MTVTPEEVARGDDFFFARYFGPEDKLLWVRRPDGGHTAAQSPMFENIVKRRERQWIFLYLGRA